MQETVTLLILPIELNHFDPVIHLDVGGLSLLYLGLDTSTPEHLGP
jgi:hypothetical protein